MKSFNEKLKTWLQRRDPTALNQPEEGLAAGEPVRGIREFAETVAVKSERYLNKKTNASLGAMAALLLVIFGGLVSLKTEPVQNTWADNEIVDETPSQVFPFETVQLEAKSAIVWDVKEGRPLYEHNADAVMPLASLVKVMTAITALDVLSSGEIVIVDADALAEEGDSGLFVDEQWKLKDLIDFSLVTSSNDGARAIAAVAGSKLAGANDDREKFIRAMNTKAKSIGLITAQFENETGLDDLDAGVTATASARDMAKLFEYALRAHPESIEATKYGSIRVESLSNIVHVGTNTNILIDRIPGILASKTGYTTLSGGNLVVVFNAGLNRPIIIAVLGSSYGGRFSDVRKLADATLIHFAGSTPADIASDNLPSRP